MVDKNDSLIREVDEELRREQLAKLWERYGTYVIAVLVAIPLLVLGYQWNQQRQRAAAEAAGARFETATNLVTDGKTDEATAAFAALAKDAPPGYAALAQLKAAGSLAAAGKKVEALAAYEALVNNGSADRVLRDFASLQAAALRVGDADFTEMQNRLTPLIADKAPWRFSARELLAVAALKAGKPDEARKMLEPIISDGAAPASLAERARLYMSRVVAAEQAAGAGAGGDARK